LLRFTANLRVRLIGMEACAGSHFLGRSLREQGHEVRLMLAQYVKPYVKTNKNDYIDAEAIAEVPGQAVTGTQRVARPACIASSHRRRSGRAG
jgi:transposase